MVPRMNRLPFVAAALTLALAATPAPGPAHATSIQKCQSADGSIGYTDGSCKVFGADSTAISSRLLDTPSDTNAAFAYPEMDRRPGMDGIGMGSAKGRRSPAAGCARTPTQLAMDLRASLAMGDVNRVAESYHWAGMENDQGQRTLDRLQQLVGRTVIDSRYLDASYGGADGMLYASSAMNAPVEAARGTLQLLLGGDDRPGTSSVDFDVHRYAGCYFVSF